MVTSYIPPLFDKDEWNSTVAAALLSPREAQVVSLIMQSHTDKEIGRLLKIRHATVRTYAQSACRRLDAERRVGLSYRTFWTFRHLTDPERFPLP